MILGDHRKEIGCLLTYLNKVGQHIVSIFLLKFNYFSSFSLNIFYLHTSCKWDWTQVMTTLVKSFNVHHIFFFQELLFLYQNEKQMLQYFFSDISYNFRKQNVLKQKSIFSLTVICKSFNCSKPIICNNF